MNPFCLSPCVTIHHYVIIFGIHQVSSEIGACSHSHNHKMSFPFFIFTTQRRSHFPGLVKKAVASVQCGCWRAGNTNGEAWRRKADLAHFCVVTGWLLCITIFSGPASETAVWNLWDQLCVHSDWHSPPPPHTHTTAGRQVFIMNRMFMFHLAYCSGSLYVKCVSVL